MSSPCTTKRRDAGCPHQRPSNEVLKQPHPVLSQSLPRKREDACMTLEPSSIASQRSSDPGLSRYAPSLADQVIFWISLMLHLI